MRQPAPVDGVVRLAFTLDPAGDAATIAEAQGLLRGYLSARLDPPAG